MIKSKFTIEIEEQIIEASKEELLKLRDEIEEMFPKEKEKEFIYIPIYSYPTTPIFWPPDTTPDTAYSPKVWYNTISNSSSAIPSTSGKD